MLFFSVSLRFISSVLSLFLRIPFLLLIDNKITDEIFVLLERGAAKWRKMEDLQSPGYTDVISIIDGTFSRCLIDSACRSLDGSVGRWEAALSCVEVSYQLFLVPDFHPTRYRLVQSPALHLSDINRWYKHLTKYQNAIYDDVEENIMTLSLI